MQIFLYFTIYDVETMYMNARRNTHTHMNKYNRKSFALGNKAMNILYCLSVCVVCTVYTVYNSFRGNEWGQRPCHFKIRHFIYSFSFRSAWFAAILNSNCTGPVCTYTRCTVCDALYIMCIVLIVCPSFYQCVVNLQIETKTSRHVNMFGVLYGSIIAHVTTQVCQEVFFALCASWKVKPLAQK